MELAGRRRMASGRNEPTYPSGGGVAGGLILPPVRERPSCGGLRALFMTGGVPMPEARGSCGDSRFRDRPRVLARARSVAALNC